MKRVVEQSERASTYALGEPLGRAHDVGRVDRFIGGDQHEAADLEFVGQIGNAAGAADVVFHRLGRIGFHQRDVLVCGGVKDHVGPVTAEDLPHAVFVGDVSDARNQFGRRAECSQLPIEREDAVLAAADQDQESVG